MTAFQPQGETARWRILYAMLRGCASGDILTYPDMGAALNLHPDDDRHAIQMAMRRAAKEFEREDKHAVDAVPNEGYRVVHDTERLGLARRYQRKAAGALETGHSKVTNVDFNGMDPNVRRGLEIVAQAFALQMDFNRRFDVKHQRLEEAVQSVQEQNRRTDEEVSELRARLERLERGE